MLVILHSLIEKADQLDDGKLYMLLINYTKAFVTNGHLILFTTLMKIGINVIWWY
jgi:hypothetical protein